MAPRRKREKGKGRRMAATDDVGHSEAEERREVRREGGRERAKQGAREEPSNFVMMAGGAAILSVLAVWGAAATVASLIVLAISVYWSGLVGLASHYALSMMIEGDGVLWGEAVIIASIHGAAALESFVANVRGRSWKSEMQACSANSDDENQPPQRGNDEGRVVTGEDESSRNEQEESQRRHESKKVGEEPNIPQERLNRDLPCYGYAMAAANLSILMAWGYVWGIATAAVLYVLLVALRLTERAFFPWNVVLGVAMSVSLSMMMNWGVFWGFAALVGVVEILSDYARRREREALDEQPKACKGRMDGKDATLRGKCEGRRASAKIEASHNEEDEVKEEESQRWYESKMAREEQRYYEDLPHSYGYSFAAAVLSVLVSWGFVWGVATAVALLVLLVAMKLSQRAFFPWNVVGCVAMSVPLSMMMNWGVFWGVAALVGVVEILSLAVHARERAQRRELEVQDQQSKVCEGRMDGKDATSRGKCEGRRTRANKGASRNEREEDEGENRQQQPTLQSYYKSDGPFFTVIIPSIAVLWAFVWGWKTALGLLGSLFFMGVWGTKGLVVAVGLSVVVDWGVLWGIAAIMVILFELAAEEVLGYTRYSQEGRLQVEELTCSELERKWFKRMMRTRFREPSMIIVLALSSVAILYALNIWGAWAAVEMVVVVTVVDAIGITARVHCRWRKLLAQHQQLLQLTRNFSSLGGAAGCGHGCPVLLSEEDSCSIFLNALLIALEEELGGDDAFVDENAAVKRALSCAFDILSMSKSAIPTPLDKQIVSACLLSVGSELVLQGPGNIKHDPFKMTRAVAAAFLIMNG